MISPFRALLSSLLVAGSFMAAAANAQNIAVVNNKPIPKAKADAEVAALVARGEKDTPELQQAVRDDLINRELVNQEVDKRNLASQPDVQTQLDRMRQQVLLSALAQDYFKRNPPSDVELHAAYEQLSKSMPSKEYHVKHILLETAPEAKAVISQLKSGTSFDTLAKKSKDPGSAANGGDLGWVSTEGLVPEFGEAMTKLKKGETTQTPVKTKFGYHVIQLVDSREAHVPSFDEAKPQLAAYLMQDQRWQQARFKAMLDDLKAKATIQ